MSSTIKDYLDKQLEKNGYLDQCEETVLHYYNRGHATSSQLWGLHKRLRALERQAKPGNEAWCKLEHDYGYVLDYQPSDHGGDPAGYKE